jgi:hypothetical protein
LTKLKKKKKIIKQNLISMEKKYKIQIDALSTRIKNAENDRKDFENKVKAKEKVAIQQQNANLLGN